MEKVLGEHVPKTFQVGFRVALLHDDALRVRLVGFPASVSSPFHRMGKADGRTDIALGKTGVARVGKREEVFF